MANDNSLKKINIQTLPIEAIGGEYYVSKSNDGSSTVKTEKGLSAEEKDALERGGTAISGKTDRIKNPASYSSITIDKDTKSIKVTAPEEVLRSPLLKQNYDEALKTIALNYRLNPEYKYALMRDSSETKTSEEWIADMDKQLKEDAPRFAAREEQKDTLKEQTGLDFSDEDLTKMATVALEYNNESGETVLVKDDTRQSVPKQIAEMEAFEPIRESYDEESGTFEWKDLKEVWDRDKTSDEAILDVYKIVDEYFSKSEFTDPTEYAQMSAFYQFVEGKDPSIKWYRGAVLTAGEVLMGAWEGTANFAQSILSAADTIGTLAGNAIEAASYATSSGESIGEAWQAAKATDTKSFVEQCNEDLDRFIADRQKEQRVLSNQAAAANAISSTLTAVGAQIVASIAVGNAAAEAAKGAVGGAVARAASGFGKTANSLATITASNIASGVLTAEELTSTVYSGTAVLLTLADAATAAKAFATAASAVRGITIASKIVVGAADVMGQAIVDVTLSDKKLFRQLMLSGEQEAKEYALQQLSQNVIGEVSGVALGRAVKGLAKTEVGRVVNAKASTRIAALKASIGQTADNLKISWFHKGNEEWLLEKAQRLGEEAKKAEGQWYGNWASNRAARAERQLRAYGANLISRQANKKVGELAGTVAADSWDDLVVTADDVLSKSKITLARANNLIDSIYKGDIAATEAAIMMDNPRLEAARKAVVDEITNVMKAEQAAGIASKAKKIKIADSGNVVTVMNEETNRYVNAMVRARYAEAYISLASDGNEIAKAKKELESLRPIIEKFETEQPQELIDAVKSYERSVARAYEEIGNTRKSLGLISEDELTAMRESGFFAEGYIRQQRIKGWEEYRSLGGRLHIHEVRGTQHWNWGSTDADWQDMSLVLFDDIEEIARQYQRKKNIETLKYLGIEIKTVVGEDGVRIVDEVNPVRKKAAATLSRSTKNAVRDFGDKVETAVSDSFVAQKTRTVVNQAETDAILSEASLGATETKPLRKITSRERAAFVKQLYPETGLDELVLLNQASPFSIAVTDDESLSSFMEALDSRTRRYLERSMDEQAGYLYEARKKTAMPEVKASPSVVDGPAAALPSSGKANYTFGNLELLMANDPDFSTKLKQQYVLNNKELAESASLERAIESQKRGKAIFDANTKYQSDMLRLNKLRAKYNLEALDDKYIESMDRLIDDIIDTNVEDKSINQAFWALGDATAGGDDLIEYATLRSLNAQKRKVVGAYQEAAEKTMNSAITGDVLKKYANDKEALAKAKLRIKKHAREYAKNAAELFETRLVDRYGEVASRLAAQGSDVVNRKDYWSIVDELNKEIAGASRTSNVIKTYGAHGYEEYVELSPTIANMFTMRPRPIRRGPFGAIQQAFVRTFRIGTTGGFIPGSLVNQGFRDFGNAIVAGNAWHTSSTVKRVLAENFGEDLAERLQNELPDVFESLLKESDATGKSVGELAVQRELDRGAANVSSELETQIYQFGREARIARNSRGIYDQTTLEKITDAIDNAQRKSEALNTMRETYLRNRVYNNNLLEALNSGMALDDAREVAKFMQAEATTNFARRSYHLANLSETVPYLGAAINGQKSFWRLFSIDPVGVSTRIVGGFVVPVIALTAHSLSTEENRRIYKQIPEYAKSDSLTFVDEGQVFSIPIPQELGAFVSATQHMVESMAGASDSSFTELMANDLLGAFPIDLSGFMGLDSDKIIEGNLATDHLVPGFVKMSSQLMPPLVKSGFMLATGIDPFTMKQIDTAYTTTDPETGEKVVMDYTSGYAAKAISKILGDKISAQMAQKILSNIFGTGGVLYIDGLADLAVAAFDNEKSFLGDGVGGFAQDLLENGLNRLTVPRYGEESNLAWNRAVAQLYREKAALLSDAEYQDDLKALSDKTISDSARKKIESRLKTRQHEYMQKVLDAANNLVDNYGGTFDRYKFGAVLSLMNLDTDSVNENPYNAYSTYLTKQEWNLNKAAAVETMQEMGFPSTNDQSLFGYYSEDQDGNVSIQYSSPLAILNYQQTERQQDKIMLALVQSVGTDKNFYDRHQSVQEQVNKIREGKTKLTNDDYNAIDAIYVNWNAEIAADLADIVSTYGAEAAINNKAVRDYLYSYIEVPNYWERNNKNRYVSLGDRGVKKAAYYTSWLRSLFKVNDQYKGQY